MGITRSEQPRNTSATLVYKQTKGGERPYTWINAPPAGEAWTNTEPVEYSETVHDIRGLDESKYGLNVTGWTALKAPTRETLLCPLSAR
jgi:hypothetical protein